MSGSLEWLKHNREPEEEVKTHWRKTSKARYNNFVKNGENDMSTYFATYPVLKQSWGHTLVNIDFEDLYKKKSTEIFVEWPLFFERFYKTADDRNLKKAKVLTNLLSEKLQECK